MEPFCVIFFLRCFFNVLKTTPKSFSQTTKLPPHANFPPALLFRGQVCPHVWASVPSEFQTRSWSSAMRRCEFHTADDNSFLMSVWKKYRVEQKLQMGLSLLNHHSPSQSLLIHVVCLFMCFSNLSKCLSCSNAKPVHLAGSTIHCPCSTVPFFLPCNLLWRSVGKCCFSKGQTKMLREAAAVAACHT